MTDYKPSAPKLQEQDLAGKVALVTGATKGIGRAIALNLSTRGASIIGTYSSPQTAHIFDQLSHTVSDLYNAASSSQDSIIPGSHNRPEGAPKMKGVAADITSLPSINAILSAIEKHFNGKLDILVLNAAYNSRPALGTATDADIHNSLTGNLQYPLVLMEQLVRHDTFNPNSRVVVISSDRVRNPSPGSSIFNATKAGLESLARSWSLELPLKFPGTTANAVSVGLTDTPGLRAFPKEAVEKLKVDILKKVNVVEGGRIGYAEDVADVVGFLCSEKSRWVTGSVVAANGGAEYIGGSH